MDRNVCPGFPRTGKISKKSKNKTFAHVIEKRSIHELPLNQEIISGGVSKNPDSFSLLIWYDLKPFLQEISDFANMLREVFRNFLESAQVKQEPISFYAVDDIVAMNPGTITSPSGLRTGSDVDPFL